MLLTFVKNFLFSSYVYFPFGGSAMVVGSDGYLLGKVGRAVCKKKKVGLSKENRNHEKRSKDERLRTRGLCLSYMYLHFRPSVIIAT